MNPDYRYEIKFVLDNSRMSDAIQWLYNKTTASKVYDNRTVNSIYFDDVGFSSVRDNLAGIAQRNKFRLRWYGNQKYSVPTFEVKTRNGRLGYKTTYQINSIKDSLKELSIDKITSRCMKDLLAHNVVFDEYLVPTLQVNYEREYYETHDGIRITIDQNIQFSDTQLHASINENNAFPYPFNVMEIKFKPGMNRTVAKLIKPLHITSKRHSKYLVGLAMLGYAVYI
jgi:SPX domain protein involved in polyphosphate accumulation